MKILEGLYFDYQASCPVDPLILTEMEPLWHRLAGNPHSANHSAGWQADERVSTARGQIAALIGAPRDEIFFTSGATEANNLAVLGIAMRQADARRNRILVSAIEHKCVLAASRAACDRFGAHVELIPVDEYGLLDMSALERLLNDEVLLVSVMAANNEVGTIQNIAAIAGLVGRFGGVLHCDAAQAPTGLDVSHLGQHADLISLSGHKMYAPQGIGILRVAESLQTEIEPQIHGGGQQGGVRSGTVPVALAVGMGIAAQILCSPDAGEERIRVSKQRDLFVELIRSAHPDVLINGPELAQRHCGNVNLAFPGVSGEDILLSLQPRLAASTGSACASGIPEPSHVLRAMGFDAERAEASIRFSFGRFSSVEHIEEGAALVIAAYRQLLAA